MIEIKKLQSDTIFCKDFQPLIKNNKIEFKKNIAVIYGPNGTGKSTLTRILYEGKDTEIELTYNNTSLNQKSRKSTFTVIKDQNSRNIITEDANEILLGENIRKERELIENLNKKQKDLIDIFNSTLKSLGITKSTHELLNQFKKGHILDFIKIISNNKNKYTYSSWTKIQEELNKGVSLVLDNEQLIQFLKQDLFSDNSACIKILSLKNITPNSKEVIILEQSRDAEVILTKYPNTRDCVVCDNNIQDIKELTERKICLKTKTREQLTPESQDILEHILDSDTLKVTNDPLNIKGTVLEAIQNQDFNLIQSLQKELRNKITEFESHIISNLSKIKLDEVIQLSKEINQIKTAKAEFTDEDTKLLKSFLKDCLKRELEIDRDPKTQNFKITLGGENFLGEDRSKLKLSSGEQNFLSLCFEILKAQRLKPEIVVIDDPISSFDSIYKNRIAFCIFRFLSKKKLIILTHNIDLIRLLEHQKPNAFNLYLFNNIEDGENGFIPVGRDELKFLLYTNEVTDFFRKISRDHIVCQKRFLISTLSFTRSLSKLNGNKHYEDLCQLMHFYKTKKINMALAFKETLSSDIPFETFEISAKDITDFPLNNEDILDPSLYPLMNRTLKNLYAYIILRLNVEKSLIGKFYTKKINDDDVLLLSDIILNSGLIDEQQRFLMTRKTLLNEFNHFEFDMSIFHPAIDINEKELNDEAKTIMETLPKLCKKT